MKSEKRRATEVVSVRFTPEELALLQETVKRSPHGTVSGFIRSVTRGRLAPPMTVATYPPLPSFSVGEFGAFEDPRYFALCAARYGWAAWKCCESGHRSVAEAAQHGAERLAWFAMSEWSEAAQKRAS